LASLFASLDCDDLLFARTLRQAASRRRLCQTCLRRVDFNASSGPCCSPTRRRCLFSAEVPCGPFRAVLVTTEAAALPLHPLHVAPVMPAAVALNAKERLKLG
jgi:hypothetical protein